MIGLNFVEKPVLGTKMDLVSTLLSLMVGVLGCNFSSLNMHIDDPVVLASQGSPNPYNMFYRR